MIAKTLLASASALLLFVSPATLAAEGPTDPQIAQIAYTAGLLDVQAGEQALRQAADPAVRQFAQTMIRDHKAVNQQAIALLKKLGVKPEASATSEKLTSQARDTAAQLGRLTGPSFDKAYIRNEVAFHRQVNEALSTTLIPNARNAQLKSLLENGLALFQAHQSHAEHLLSQLK